MRLPDPRVTPGYRWSLVVLFMLCSTSVIWYSFAIGILIPEMRGDLGLTPSQEGWLSASFFLAAFVFTIPISTVLSRFAPVPVMTTVFVGTSALFFLAAYLPSYPAQIGVRFLVSLLFIAASPARTLLVHDWFRPSEIGGANGAMNSMYGIIEPVAFFATAPLLTALGWQGVFWFLGVLSVVTTVGWILIARDAPSAHRTRGNADAAPRGAGPLSVIRRKDTLFLAMVSFGGDFAWASMITFWPTLAEESFGFSKNFIGVLLALSSLMTFPTALLSPLVVRFVGGQRPVLIGFTLLQVPVFALLAVSSNVAVLAVCMTMQGVCWIYGPVLNTSPFLMPRITAREVAVVVAVMTVSRTGAQTVGPALAGLLAEAFPLSTVLLWTAFAPLVSVLGAVLLSEMHPGRAVRPGESTGQPAPIH